MRKDTKRWRKETGTGKGDEKLIKMSYIPGPTLCGEYNHYCTHSPINIFLNKQLTCPYPTTILLDRHLSSRPCDKQVTGHCELQSRSTASVAHCPAFYHLLRLHLGRTRVWLLPSERAKVAVPLPWPGYTVSRCTEEAALVSPAVSTAGYLAEKRGHRWDWTVGS